MLQFFINVGNPERISPATPWTHPHSYTDVGRNTHRAQVSLFAH
jgi:hypothetical protein